MCKCVPEMKRSDGTCIFCENRKTSKPASNDLFVPAENQIHSACMSFRHDYGWMEYLRAWQKEAGG